jgi:hypothetical protein
MNLFTKSPIYALCLVLSLGLSACSKDDDKKTEETPQEQVKTPAPGTITCKINGDAFSSSYPFTTGTLYESGTEFNIAIGGVNASFTGSKGIALGIYGASLADVRAGDVFTATSDPRERLAVGAVTISNANTDEDADSGETGKATITITKIDHTQKTISGTFAYEAKDPDTGSVFIVTEGVFTAVQYD